MFYHFATGHSIEGVYILFHSVYYTYSKRNVLLLGVMGSNVETVLHHVSCCKHSLPDYLPSNMCVAPGLITASLFRLSGITNSRWAQIYSNTELILFYILNTGK